MADERTSRRVAGQAARILRDKNASPEAKSVAASALSQAPDRPGRKVYARLVFSEQQKSPTLEIGHGEYRRKFDVKDQPFECETKSEARMLLRTGNFVEQAAAGSEQAAGAEAAATAPDKIDTTPPVDNALDPNQ